MDRRRFWYFNLAAKVLVIMVLAICAMAYLFGFASVLFDKLAAGYVAAGLVACIGVGAATAMIVKDVRSNWSAKEIKE